jgi:class 3 adenylate cyclase
MTLKQELEAGVAKILSEVWKKREGRVVPESEDLQLGNDAITLNGTILYADLSDSTGLVDSRKPFFAAEVYKAYLFSAAKIIRSRGGVITAYDGDRIMAVFIGDSKNTSAAKAALNINWATRQIINPALTKQYPNDVFTVKQTVGIDTSDLWVARTGVRGANDLVWVGRAANHAAKLASMSPDYPSWISGDVYDCLAEEAKVAKDGRNMWEERVWTKMNNRRIYRSNWTWSVT